MRNFLVSININYMKTTVILSLKKCALRRVELFSYDKLVIFAMQSEGCLLKGWYARSYVSGQIKDKATVFPTCSLSLYTGGESGNERCALAC